MKIGIAYTQIYPPKKGASGADRRVRDIARGLKIDNNDIIIYIPRWHNSENPNIDENFYKTIYIGTIFDSVPYLNRLFFWNKLVKIAKKDELESFIFYSPTIDSAIALNGLKKKGIVTTIEFCDLMSSNSTNLIMRFLLRCGEKYLPSLSQTAFVISSYIEEFVHKNAPNTPTVTIPILVDPETFYPSKVNRNLFREKYNISKDEIVIAYVGGMWINYGVQHLIEAFYELSKRTNRKIKLVIGGSLKFNENYTDANFLVKKFGIESLTILTGWADTELVKQILNGSDILTAPHCDDMLNKAGLPTKLAEYACIGKAIVASNVGDVSKYFIHKENAFLSKGSNVESLANALFEVVENTELRSKLGTNARITALNIFDFKINGIIINNVLISLNKNKII